MNDNLEQLLNKHQHLLLECCIASKIAYIAVPKDMSFENVPPRKHGNVCISTREDAIIAMLYKTTRAYKKYKQYSEFEVRPVTVSLTLYQRLKEHNLLLKN